MEKVNFYLKFLTESPKARPYWGVLLWLAFVALLIQTPITTRWLDFPVYWEAGQKALVGLTVYDVPGHFQYKYSPLIALLFGKIFGGFTFETASWLFQKSNLIAWLAIFVRMGKGHLQATVGLLLFFGAAIRLDLALGQLNAWVFLLLLSLFGSLEKRPSWGCDLTFGFLFSIAVQLKLFALVLIPLLLLKREWRKLALGLLFLPLLSIGGYAITHGFAEALAENRAWISSLAASTDELLLSPQNVGLLGTASKVFGLLAGKIIWALTGAGFLFYLHRERARPVEWFRNRLFYVIAFFNPLVWSYWVLYTLPLFAEKASRLNIPRAAFYRITFVIGSLFVFAAFVSQHATWAWQGGIFTALLLLGIFDPDPLSQPERKKPVLRVVE